jgi:hypothetical protein
MNKCPCSNSVYRKLERGEYTDDEYMKPKTDEYGCEILLEEEDFIDMDDFDDFEEIHENYITDDEFSSSSDEDEWSTV